MKRNLPVYAAVIVGALVIALDFASVDLAVPSMERQFGLDFDSVQWVINGYVLAFSVLMVAGGRIADACGRRRVFLIGMSIFAISSLLGGAAWSGGSLIFFRVLQGMGGALLWPAMIGMACAAVGEEKRSVALGLIFGTCSLGNVGGPLVGGALTQWVSWRAVLWINVPLAIAAILLTMWAIKKDEVAGERPRNDYPGMITLTGGLVSLMLAVYQGQSWGWGDARTLLLIAVAVVLLGLFPFLERRAKEPLVPLELMRSREFMTLCLCIMVVCQLIFIIMLYFTQYGMKFLGDDPMWAGIRVVQFMLTYAVISFFGGPLMSYFGARCLLTGGLLCAAIGSALLAAFGPAASPIVFNGALVLVGVGIGAVTPTVSALAIEAAGSDRASLASGVTFMCQLGGSAFLLAANTAIFMAVSRSALHAFLLEEHITLAPSKQAAIEQVLSGARLVNEIPIHHVAKAAEYAHALAAAYRMGLSMILILATALLLVALALVLRFVRKPAH